MCTPWRASPRADTHSTGPRGSKPRAAVSSSASASLATCAVLFADGGEVEDDDFDDDFDVCFLPSCSVFLSGAGDVFDARVFAAALFRSVFPEEGACFFASSRAPLFFAAREGGGRLSLAARASASGPTTTVARGVAKRRVKTPAVHAAHTANVVAASTADFALKFLAKKLFFFFPRLRPSGPPLAASFMLASRRRFATPCTLTRSAFSSSEVEDTAADSTGSSASPLDAFVFNSGVVSSARVRFVFPSTASSNVTRSSFSNPSFSKETSESTSRSRAATSDVSVTSRSSDASSASAMMDDASATATARVRLFSSSSSVASTETSSSKTSPGNRSPSRLEPSRRGSNPARSAKKAVDAALTGVDARETSGVASSGSTSVASPSSAMTASTTSTVASAASSGLIGDSGSVCTSPASLCVCVARLEQHAKPPRVFLAARVSGEADISGRPKPTRIDPRGEATRGGTAGEPLARRATDWRASSARETVID
mmetsp:Transcript_4816/g.20465  ORF Transcript_4816/g.20465 Transcript_4816/m.20465 type:complete len:487 (+) Transcript_4816:824-2284(+)